MENQFPFTFFTHKATAVTRKKLVKKLIHCSYSVSFIFLSIHDELHFDHTSKTHQTGKEEERAMFQQMQAMAQKQVNTEQFLNKIFCLILI